MLVTFKTHTHANITMFGDIAVALLKKMGHSGTVPSAMGAADIPEALHRLTAVIEAEQTAPPKKARDKAKKKENDDDEDEGPVVSLAHRALPLISLLKAAAEAGDDVMWS